MAQNYIYLDHASTTPVDPRVVSAMMPWLAEHYGNPASAHYLGQQAAEAVEQARIQVASLIGATAMEIIFTSGATEANNLAIKGAVHYHLDGRAKDKLPHIVSCKTEHKSVLDTVMRCGKDGCKVTMLPVDESGHVDLEALAAVLETQPLLVSVMWVNNETGLVQNIREIARMTRSSGVMLHVDAAQAGGKITMDMAQVPVDLLSLSAHKMGGPKGVGALYIRQRPRARIAAQMEGGGHERGFRSGTLASHQIVGFGKACEYAEELLQEQPGIRALKQTLWQGLQSLGGVHYNGDDQHSTAGILNVSFEGCEGESLITDLELAAGDDPALLVSRGSSCSSASTDSSHVLRAMGLDDGLANAAIRFSLGNQNTADDIATALRVIGRSVNRLRSFSPCWPKVTDIDQHAGTTSRSAAGITY